MVALPLLPTLLQLQSTEPIPCLPDRAIAGCAPTTTPTRRSIASSTNSKVLTIELENPARMSARMHLCVPLGRCGDDEEMSKRLVRNTHVKENLTLKILSLAFWIVSGTLSCLESCKTALYLVFTDWPFPRPIETSKQDHGRFEPGERRARRASSHPEAEILQGTNSGSLSGKGPLEAGSQRCNGCSGRRARRSW